MAGFFQQLIDLGEEKPTVSPAGIGHSEEDIGKMSRADLVAEVQKLTHLVAEKENERRQVQEEALANQSKHEAYRKNVDMWQQQMKEMRAADKKMIDELRAAGSTGKIDDAYLKSTNETIEGLKQSLKDARDDAAKAYKRQREAEEMRSEYEKSSKTEFQELFMKFDSFRERSKQASTRLEQQVVQLTDDNASLRERLAIVTAQIKEQAQQYLAQISALNEEVRILREQQQQQKKSHDRVTSSSEETASGTHEASEGEDTGARKKKPTAVNEKGMSVAYENEENERSAVNSSDGLGLIKTNSAAAISEREKELSALTSRLTALSMQNTDLKLANETLTNEVATMKIQLSAAVAREEDAEAKCRKANERLQSLEQDLEWQKVEADKKALGARSVADSARAKIQQAEAKLEAKEEEMRNAERSHIRVVRDLEDAIAAEKDKFTQLLRKSEEKEQFLEEQIQQEKEKLAANTDKVGEAEETTKRTSEALESQRMHFEIQLAQRDTRIQELYGVRQALEAALQESREDVRRLEDTLQDLRREVSTKDDVVRLAEQSQSELQRNLVAREEDLQAREKERQSLRTRLRDEEDRGIELQSILRELELRVTELDAELKRKESQKSFSDSEIIRLQNIVEGMQETSHAQSTLLQVKESQLADATRRLQDHGVRNADIVRMREDQISAIRAYEKKINELEKQLAMAQSNTMSAVISSSHGGKGADPSSYGLNVLPPLAPENYVSQMERRQQMLSEAFASAKRSTGLGNLTAQQVKLLVVGAVVLVVFVSIINGLRSLSAAGVGNADFDSLSIIREKYAQTLQSLTLCQEQLVASSSKK